MIVLPFFAAAISLPDLEALRSHIAQCDKGAVSRVFADEPQRRATFLIDAVKEQRNIADARLALVERRKRLRAMPNVDGDSADAISAASQELDDRQQALNDRRTLDAQYRDALDFLRQNYLATCTQGTQNALSK